MLQISARPTPHEATVLKAKSCSPREGVGGCQFSHSPIPMNIYLLLNNPVFWLTIFVAVFFSSITAFAIRKTNLRNLTKKEKIGVALILFGEVGAIMMILFFSWLTFKESILWTFQSHDNLATTAGKVIESKTEWGGDAAHNASGLHFQIWYEYRVKGTVYRSNRVSYGYTGSSDESFAEDYVRKYPVGKSVIVYYDSLDPKKSILEPDVIAYDGFLVLIMTTIMCLLAIPATFAWLTKFRAQQSV